jgi:hypothetical protein
MEPFKVNNVDVVFNFRDNGGRRVGIERRQFSYASHIPERRYSEGRRSCVERRMIIDRRENEDRRESLNRRSNHDQPLIDLRNYKDRRGSVNRRRGIDRRDFIIV